VGITKKRRKKALRKSAQAEVRSSGKRVRAVAQSDAGGSGKSKRDSKGSTRGSAGVSPCQEPVSWLTVVGARQNNLKNIDVSIPLGRFVAVTGVSGSGKSSLVNDILREALARDLNGAENVHPGHHDRINGIDHLDKVIDIDRKSVV